jgi:hypothetical protein
MSASCRPSDATIVDSMDLLRKHHNAWALLDWTPSVYKIPRERSRAYIQTLVDMQYVNVVGSEVNGADTTVVFSQYSQAGTRWIFYAFPHSCVASSH